MFSRKQVVMAEEVLSDALVNALYKKIDIVLYPVRDFAIDLGFTYVAASEAEELAIQKQHPLGKYEYLLQMFVATHGRDEKAAQDLIDIFKVKGKMLLVNFLENAIKEQNALKQSELYTEGQEQTRTGARARKKTFRKCQGWKFVQGLILLATLFVAACTCYYDIFRGSKPDDYDISSVSAIIGSHFEVRLVNGMNNATGRVEVLNNADGTWGTVCDYGWNLDEANAVCRVLGFSTASSANSKYDPGSGDIFLDEVECTGSEKQP